MSSVEIVTPTIEGRAEWLSEACASVQAQTLPAARHLVLMDDDDYGPATARNMLIGECRERYVAFLDDDDTLDANHLELLVSEAMATGADLVFSWHRTTGERAPETPRFMTFSRAAKSVMQSGRNIIPITVVARRAAIIDAGCFDPADRYEDYALWMRMLDAGGHFVCIPQETWTYRFHDENRTWLPS